MKRSLPLFFGSILLLVACGGSSAPATAPEGEEAEHEHHHGEHAGEHVGEATGHHGEEHGEHGEHHPPMDEQVHAFHEILAPAYHMDKGTPRTDKACESVPAMKDAAGKINASRTSEEAKTMASKLGSEVDALATACAAADHAGVDPQLDKLHAAFHGVMEAH